MLTSLDLDKKDLRLLELLAQNCRITHAALATALHVSKDTVPYRLTKLEKAGILKQFVTFIDARGLGFGRYHLLFRITSQIPDLAKIVHELCKNPAVMWLNTFLGRYDIQIIVDAEDSFALNRIKEDLFKRCEYAIAEYSILSHLCDFEFTQLNPVLDLGTQVPKRADHSFSDVLTARKFPVGMEIRPYEIDRYEVEILALLAEDPRMGISDIAEKIHSDRVTVRKKILALIKGGVILNFGGIPNLFELGFVTYYILVRLRQNTPLEAMQKPFRTLRNIFYAGRMTGDYDMILYLNARTPHELDESIRLFKKDMGQFIVHYDLLIQDKVHHWRQFTHYLYSQLKNRVTRNLP